jgi:hypothetical protein
MTPHLIIVPLTDPTKPGSSEQVRALTDAFAAEGNERVLALKEKPFEAAATGATSFAALRDRLTAARSIAGPDDRFVLVASDYGATPVANGTSLLEAARALLGPERTVTLLSSHTLENKAIQEAFRSSAIDYLAVPSYSLAPKIIGRATYDELVAPRQDRILRMTGVPLCASAKLLTSRAHAWQDAAQKGDVQPLPTLSAADRLIVALIPGDIDNGLDQPLIYTPAMAARLGKAVRTNLIGSPSASLARTVVIVSDGYRTGKYDSAAVAAAGTAFHPSKKDYQHQDRFDSLAAKPVTRAFMTALDLDASVLVNASMMNGVPKRGYLAAYQALNDHARQGGEAILVVDGASTTLLHQAMHVLDPRVVLVAADSEAKLETHRIGLAALVQHGAYAWLDTQGILHDTFRPRAQTSASDAERVAHKMLTTLLSPKPKPKRQPSAAPSLAPRRRPS